jgi:hypothetical protein
MVILHALQQNATQQYRAHRINVLQRIEAFVSYHNKMPP